MALIGREERTGNVPATSPLRFRFSLIAVLGGAGALTQKGGF
jgi:hypothetical protein